LKYRSIKNTFFLESLHFLTFYLHYWFPSSNALRPWVHLMVFDPNTWLMMEKPQLLIVSLYHRHFSYIRVRVRVIPSRNKTLLHYRYMFIAYNFNANIREKTYNSSYVFHIICNLRTQKYIWSLGMFVTCTKAEWWNL
jgi:hypothetical protein